MSKKIKNKQQNVKKSDDTPLNIIIYFIIILACFLYNKHSSYPAGGPRWILLILSSTILPFIFILKNYNKLGNSKLNFTTFHFLVFIFVIWFSLSRIWTVDKMNYVEEFIQHISVFLLLIFFSFYGNRLNHRNLIYLFAIILFIVSFFGLLQYYGLDGNIYTQTARPASVFVNKNLATPLISLLIPFLFLPILFLKDKRAIIFFTISLSFSLAYLIVAATRSSWVGVLSSIFFMLFLFSNKKIRRNLFPKMIKINQLYIVSAFILAFLFVNLGSLNKNKPLMTTTISAQIESIFNIDKDDFKVIKPKDEQTKKEKNNITKKSKSKNKERKENILIPKEKNPTLFKNSSKSIRMRIAKWLNSFEIVKESPLIGIGLGSFSAVYPNYHKRVLLDEGYEGGYFYGELHNDIYQYLIELGVIGFLLILLIIFYILFMLTKILKYKLNTYEQIFYLASTIGLSAILVDSLFNYPLRYPTYLLLLTVIIGKIHAKYFSKESSNLKVNYALNLKGKVFSLLIIFAILSILAINIANKKRLSEKSFSAAIAYEQLGKLDKTWASLKQTIDYWPYKSSNIIYGVAICYENFRANKTKRKYLEVRKYDKLALENLPYHYIPNYIHIKLLSEYNSWKKEENLDEEINRLLDVTPQGPRRQKTYEALGYLSYLMGDYEDALQYNKKLRKIKPNNKDIQKRIKLLKKLITEKE